MHCMQLCRTDHSSPGLLSSGIMLVSTGLLWSEIGSTTITISHFYTCPLTALSKCNWGILSAWRWKVYDRQTTRPHDSSASNGRGMRRHWGGINPRVDSAHKAIFPRCLAREDIACDVDEVLWPDPNRRRDP